jgi:two-component system, NarL family, nitrate/nitrite response regulator NarL
MFEEPALNQFAPCEQPQVSQTPTQPAGQRRIRVAVVAPPVMCWALEQLLRSTSLIEVVATSTEIPGQALASEQLDVVVLDFEGSLESAELIAFLEQRKARVIVFTNADDPAALDHALVCGLQGIVRKSDSPRVLLHAIEKVSQGELWMDRSTTSRVFMKLARQRASEKSDPEVAKASLLTHRERHAIAALASDTSAPAKVIASRLCISEHTLRNHLTSIYSKLELTNRLDLYAYAMRHHLDKVKSPEAPG